MMAVQYSTVQYSTHTHSQKNHSYILSMKYFLSQKYGTPQASKH